MAQPQNLLLEWSVDDVCDWLKAQGLEEYLPSFRENRIDGQELQSLNTDTLVNDLGVSKCRGRCFGAECFVPYAYV